MCLGSSRGNTNNFNLSISAFSCRILYAERRFPIFTKHSFPICVMHDGEKHLGFLFFLTNGAKSGRMLRCVGMNNDDITMAETKYYKEVQ